MKQAEAGEEITITRYGTPVARLVSVEMKTNGKQKSIRPLGFGCDEVLIADDFDAPLPDDLLKAFCGGKLPKLENQKGSKRKSKR